jgi:ubiquinone/menaquinone biosynthesis C-methylase UbiE
MMSPVTIEPHGHPWDQAADGWNRHSALINRWLQDVTGAMLSAAGVSPGSRVLDVAAGAGGQTLEIARRVGSGGSVLATDISPRILMLAAENARLAGLGNVQTQVADAETLGMTGVGFDAAVSRLGLMFCGQPLTALREIRAALRPGGRLAAVVFSHPAANPCVGILMNTALRHAGVAGTSPFTPGTLFSLGQPGLIARLLAEAGFSDIRVEPVSVPMQLPSSRDYMDFVHTSASPIIEILAPLPEAARAEAWNDMEAQLGRFTGPEGWCGPNELLLCSAEAGSLALPG